MNVRKITHTEAQCRKSTKHASVTRRRNFSQVERDQADEHAETKAMQESARNQHANDRRGSDQDCSDER